ncbi:MAG TPA: MarR family transcriptional regulator [Ramlibacter sp.]|nr:MarR family transcriptional regulator [Ramlibacter sp.]
MSLEKPKRIDELLNYRLARLLALSSAPGIRLFEGGYGVSRREWSLVGMVAVHGPMSPSELAALAHLDRPRVSRVISQLVINGLLARSHVPNDRRRAQIAITAPGQKLYEEVFPQVARINKAVLGALTPDQLAAFDEALHILTRSAEELVRTTPVTVKAARHLGGRRSSQISRPRKEPAIKRNNPRNPARVSKA